MVSMTEDSVAICTLESWFRIPVVIAAFDEVLLWFSYNGSLHSNVMFNTVNCLKRNK